MKGQRNDLRWAQHLLPPVKSQRRESKAKRLRWKVRKEKDTEIKKTCRESRKQETARKKVKGTVPVRRENVGASTSTVKFWSYMSYWFWRDAIWREGRVYCVYRSPHKAPSLELLADVAHFLSFLPVAEPLEEVTFDPLEISRPLESLKDCWPSRPSTGCTSRHDKKWNCPNVQNFWNRWMRKLST